MDSGSIAQKYIASPNFLLDILSTIPFNTLHITELQFFGLLKLTRVLRMNTVIMNMNTSQQIKAALKVIQLILGMFLYIHWMACIWFYVV